MRTSGLRGHKWIRSYMSGHGTWEPCWCRGWLAPKPEWPSQFLSRAAVSCCHIRASATRQDVIKHLCPFRSFCRCGIVKHVLKGAKCGNVFIPKSISSPAPASSMNGRSRSFYIGNWDFIFSGKKILTVQLFSNLHLWWNGKGEGPLSPWAIPVGVARGFTLLDWIF